MNKSGLERCGVLLDPCPGDHVSDVARLTLEAASLMPSVVRGFVFNGKVVRLRPGDTAADLLARYQEKGG